MAVGGTPQIPQLRVCCVATDHHMHHNQQTATVVDIKACMQWHHVVQNCACGVLLRVINGGRQRVPEFSPKLLS